MENVIFLGIGIVLGYVGVHVAHAAYLHTKIEEMKGEWMDIYHKRFDSLKNEFDTSKAEIRGEVAQIGKKLGKK